MSPKTELRLKIAYAALPTGLLTAYLLLPLLSNDLHEFGERAVLLWGLVLMLSPISSRLDVQDKLNNSGYKRADDNSEPETHHPGMSRRGNPTE